MHKHVHIGLEKTTWGHLMQEGRRRFSEAAGEQEEHLCCYVTEIRSHRRFPGHQCCKTLPAQTMLWKLEQVEAGMKDTGLCATHKDAWSNYRELSNDFDIATLQHANTCRLWLIGRERNLGNARTFYSDQQYIWIKRTIY